MPKNSRIRGTAIALAITAIAGFSAISLSLGHADSRHAAAGFGWDAPITLVASTAPAQTDGFGWD